MTNYDIFDNIYIAITLKMDFLTGGIHMKIRMKILIPMFLLNILVVGFMGGIIYQRISAEYLSMAQEQALTMANVASQSIDAEKLEALDVGDEDTQDYSDVMEELNSVKANSGIAYLVTLKEMDGTVCYVMDTDESEARSSIGDAFEYGSDEYTEALEGAFADSTIDTDEYGSVLSAYAPIYASDGTTIVGVVDSDYDASGILASEKELVLLILLFGVIAVAISTIVMSLIVNRILKSLNAINVKVNEMANNNGDLTDSINVHTKDETGIIAKNMNQFIEYIRVVITNISKATKKLDESSQWLTAHSNEIMDSVTGVSGVMEEMSAGMEETSASIIQVNELMDDMKQSFVDMNSNAKESAEYTQEITGKANELRKSALDTKKEVIGMASEMETVMTEKIEESKAVEKIAELTEDILAISSQTNVLALNASIEAARAGESGKGFAVVAERINELASSTASTASQIQEISRVVIEKVNELAIASERMIQFLNDKTADGYDQLVQTSNDYQNDSKVMFDIMQDFAGHFQLLDEKVQYVHEAISDISKAAEENTLGVTNVSETTLDIMNNLSEIQERIAENEEMVKILREEEGKFIL